MNNQLLGEKQKRNLRTARQSVSFAIEESIAVGKILKKLEQIFDNQFRDNILKINNREISHANVTIYLSGYELNCINRALCDYVTLRIANIVDPHPASLSLKDFKKINPGNIKDVPEIKKIIEARNNWIAHINRRFIGPTEKNNVYSEKVVGLLETLLMLISTRVMTESK